MPSPFSIDIAGPLAEGMRIAMARQQMAQSALFRDAELRMAERRAQEQARYRDELMDEREQNRLLRQQMQTERLNAGAVPTDLAAELGLIQEPAIARPDSLGIGAAWGGIPMEPPPDQAPESTWGGTPGFDEIPMPAAPAALSVPEARQDDGVRRFSAQAWQSMSPQLQDWTLRRHMESRQKQERERAEWESIERAMRNQGASEGDIAATRATWTKRRGGLPVMTPYQEWQTEHGGGRSTRNQLPEMGTPEYASLLGALTSMHPETFRTPDDAAAYIESRRAGLVNQARAPGTGVPAFDPAKDPDVVRARRIQERAERALERVQAAVLSATGDSSKGLSIDALKQQEAEARRALDQADADYDRAMERARNRRGAPVAAPSGISEKPAGMADSVDARGGYGDPRMNQAQDMQAVESLGGPVMARLRQTLGRNPTREEFRAAMQAAMDELYTPKPAAPAKQPRGQIPASPFADLTKRPQ